MSVAYFLPLPTYHEFPPPEMANRARPFRDEMLRRRTVRRFSSRPVSREVIEDYLSVACSAPSVANKQPWHFVVVSNPEVKSKIRTAAEEEERRFYSGRAPQEWLDALAPLGTDENKPYLETAPCLIVIFAEHYEVAADGRKLKSYYVTESVGIATGCSSQPFTWRVRGFTDTYPEPDGIPHRDTRTSSPGKALSRSRRWISGWRCGCQILAKSRSKKQ